MTEPDATAPAVAPSPASRFFANLAERPRFVLPLVVLTACAFVYVEVAVRKAFPYVVPDMLDRTLLPETELRANLHQAFRTASLLIPALAIPWTALLAWACLAPFRARPAFSRVLALVSHASLPISLGLLVKAGLALATGHADPPVNLGAFATATGPLERAAFGLTNPFGWLAIGVSVAGLRAFGASRAAAWVGGGLPWAAWMAGLAMIFGGDAQLAPKAPVPTEDWPEMSGRGVTLRYPPDEEKDAKTLFDLVNAFSDRLQGRLSFRPDPLRIHVFPDHGTLERATGEILHVLITGSIRGTDLLYLEMPGKSVALTREAGLREALRWVGLVRLAPAAGDAPRWFVEGFVHAAVQPGTPELDREFRATLRREGVPTYARLLDPATFRAPSGPLFARSLVDHIAFVAGREAPEQIMRRVVTGTPFRDALFEVTHLTASVLEDGWTTALRSIAPDDGGTTPAAPPDTATGRLDDVAPFLQGR